MKLVLKNVVLSFPSLFETAKYMGDDLGKYEATFLIPKDDPQAKAVQEAIKEIGSDVLGKDWGKAKLCLLDGDTKDYDGYAGCWALKASTKKRPVLLDRDKSAISQEDGKMVGGNIVNASVSVYAFQNNYGRFVACQLNAIQYAAEGTPFGSGAGGYSDDDFDSVESDDITLPGDGAPF